MVTKDFSAAINSDVRASGQSLNSAGFSGIGKHRL